VIFIINYCVKLQMWYVLWARKVPTDFWWGNLKETPGVPRCRWEDDIKMGS